MDVVDEIVWVVSVEFGVGGVGRRGRGVGGRGGGGGARGGVGGGGGWITSVIQGFTAEQQTAVSVFFINSLF